ncbi:protein of unknown function [Legionella pneumophila subsp. pneumophila]|nr:protein of unknown function [Legionella pneumophila subsp. pneumophila]
MIKYALLKNWRYCLLISVTFLLCSCEHYFSKNDSENNTPVNKSFIGYHPHGHGHGRH